MVVNTCTIYDMPMPQRLSEGIVVCVDVDTVSILSDTTENALLQRWSCPMMDMTPKSLPVLIVLSGCTVAGKDAH